MTPDEHRRLRELIGTYALGQLPTWEALPLQAHLDGCDACRHEYDELAPLAVALRRVDVGNLGVEATPPAALGGLVLAAVAREKPLRDRRSRRRTALLVASVAAAALGLLSIGAVADRQLRDPATIAAAPSKIPMEPVRLQTSVAGVAVTQAVVIPHTWGIELQMAATGLADGTLYRGQVTSVDGRTLPAGEFFGVAGKTVKCNLQAALLREDTRSFEIVDATGGVVMQAQLT